MGPISASSGGKCVKLQVLSPTHISTPSGAGKGMAGKSLGKAGTKQSLTFQAPRSAATPAPAISPDYLRSLSAVKQKKMVELDNILDSSARKPAKNPSKQALHHWDYQLMMNC